MEKKNQEFKESVGFSRVESGVSSSELPDLPPPWEVGKLTTIVKFPFDDETNQHLQMESAFACSNHTSAIVVVVDSKRKIRVLGWLDVFQPLRPRYIALKILDRGIVAAHSVIIPTLGQDATSKINQNVALSTDNRNEYFLHVEYAQRHLDSDQVHSRTETVCVDFFIRRRNERNIFTFLPSLERSVELSAVNDKDKDKESEEKKSSTLGVQIKREFGASSAVEENEIVTKAFSILPENQHLFTFSDSGSLVIKAGKSMTKFDKHNTTNSSLATQLDLSRQLDSLLHVYRTPEQFQDSLNSSLVGGIGGTGVVSHHGGLCKVIFDKIPKADYSGALTATFSLSQVDGESEVYSKSYPQRIDLSQQALKHVKCDDDIVVYTTKLNGDAKQNSGKTEGGKFLCHTENATPTANENQWHALPVPVNERLESEPRKIIGETLELILHSTHYIDMKTETKTRVKTAIRIYRNAIIINALNSVKSPNFNLLSTGFQGTRMGTVILIDILKFQNLTPTQLQITLHSMVLATTWLFLTRTPLKDDLLTSSPENAKATMERLWTSWFKVMMKNIPLADLANGVELSPFRGAWLDAKKKYSSEWSATVWDSFRVELGDIFALLEQMALPETVQLLRQYLAFPQAQIMSWNLNSNLELLDMSKFLMNTSHQQVTALVQTAFSWRIQLIHQTWHVKNFEHMAIAYAPSRMLDENKTFQEILFNVIHFATYFILSNHKRFLKEDKFPFMDRAVGLQHPIGPVSSARKIQLVLDKTIVESFSSHTAVSIPLVESKTERMVYEAQNYGEFINNLISVIEMILMRFISISPSDKTGTGAGAGVGGFNFICEASDVQSIVCGYQDNITSDRDNIAWLVFDKNELKSLVDRYLGIINSNESDQNIVLDWKCKPTTTAKWTDLMRTCNTICDQFTNAFSRTSNGPVPAFQIYKSSCSLLASLLTDPPTFIKKEAGLEYKRQNPIEWPQRSAKIFPRVIFDEGDRFEFNRTEAGNQLVYFESKTFSATHIEIDSDEEEDENEDEDEVDQVLGLQPMFQSKKRRLKLRLEGKDTLPEQIPITDSLEKYSLRLRNTQTRMDMSIVDQKTEFDYPKYQARDIINQTIATDPLFFKHPTKNIMPELAPRAIQAKHYLFATLTALVARYCIPGDISKRGLKSTKPSIAFGLYTLISNYQRVSNQDTFLTTKKNVSQQKQKQKQKQKRGRKPKSSLANLLDLDTSSADNVDVDVDADVDDTSNFGDVNEDEENLPADIKQLSLKKTLEQIAGRRLDSLITTSLELLRAVVSADMNGSLEQFKSSSKKNNNKGEKEDDENDDDDTATATKTAEQNGKDEKDEKHSAHTSQNSPGKKRKQPPVDLETETTQESKVGTTTTISTPPKKKNRYNDTPPSSPQPSTSVRSSRKRSPSSSDTETDESEVESETESESEDSERNNDDEESDKDSSEDDQDSDTEKIQVKKEASKSVDRKGETKTSTKPKSKSKAQVKATTKATSKEKTFGDEFGFTPQDIASLHIKRKATRNTERGVKTKTGKFEFFKKRIYERMGKIGLDKKKQSTTVIVKLLVQTFTPIHILGVFFYFAYATETKQTVSEDEKKDLLEDLQERLNEIGQELIYGIEEIRKLSVVKKNMTSIFSTPAQIKSAKKLIDGQLLDHFLRLKTLYNHQFEVVRDKLLVEYLSEVDNGQILKSDTVTEWLHSFANKLSPLKDDENYSFISRLITSMALETSKQGIVGNKKYATFSTQFIDLCQQESTGEAMNFLIDLLPTDAQLKRVISRQDAYDICVYQQKWPSVKNEKNEKNEKKKDTDVAMSDVNAEAEAESTAETETETESETQAKKTAQAAKIRLLRAQIMANQMGGPAILEDYISEKNGSLAASEVYFRLFMRTLPDDVKKNKLGNQHNQEEIKKTITAFYTLDLKPNNEKDWSKIADASFMDQVHVFQHDARFWYYQINFRTSEYWTRLVRHGGGRPPDEGRSLDESGPLTTRQIPTDDFKLLSENSDTIKLAEYQKYDLVDVGEPPEDTLRDFIMGTMVLYQLFTNGECSKTFEHWMGFVGNIIGTSEMINHDSAPGSKSGLVFNQPTRNSPFPNNQLVFLWYNRVLPIFKVVEEQLSNTNVNAPHEKARNQVYRQYLSERVCHIIFSELPYSERFNPEGTSTENNMYRRYLLAIGSYKKTKALAKARWAEAEARAKEKLRTKIKSKRERARKSVKSSKSASSSSKEEKNENDEKDSDEGDVNMLAAKSSIVDRKDRDQLRDEENIKYSRNAARLFSYILPLESGKTEVDDNTMSSFFQNDLLNLTKIALKNKTIPTMPGENGRERWTRGYFPSIFLTYFSLVFRRVLRSRQFLSLIQGTDPEFQKLANGNPFQIERGKLFLQEKAPESGPVRKFDQSVQNDLLDAVIRYKGGEVKQTLSDVQPQLSTIEQLRAVESSAAVVLSRSSTTTKGSSAALKKPPSGLVSGSGSGSGSGSTSVSRPPTSASTFVNASASIYNVGASTANRALFKNSITPLKSSSTRPASLVSTTTERKVPTERKAGATNASTNAVLSAVLNAKQPNPTDLPVASAIFSASFADRAKQADQINASLQQYLKKNQSRVNQGSF